VVHQVGKQRYGGRLIDAARCVEGRDDGGDDCSQVYGHLLLIISQEMLKADRERLRQGRDLAYRQQHARHERRTVHRVVTDRQRLADVAEDDLFVSDLSGAAACISSAVRLAVPLGLSSLRSWCISMISAERM
jgi:hypothetical protein